MNAIAYAHDHREKALEELRALLEIPSISTLSEHAQDMERAARWLRRAMLNVGLERAEILPTRGHPVVFGEWLGAGEDAFMVLVYGHYDVQPPDPLEEWESDPFVPMERGGSLYARGAADDKGQLFIHLKAIEALMRAEGGLPINIKVLLEGEEEIGSTHLHEWIKENRELLTADVAVISDSHILSREQPTLVYGLRGLCYIEVLVQSARSDLHSGAYGGAVHNPVQALCEIIAQLHDEEGRVTVPGFYDRVRPLDEEERREFARVPFDAERLKEETGVLAPWGEPEYTIVERITARPTLELNGIWGGFQGEGAKTVLPARAGAKISMRLVPDQDHLEMADLVGTYIRQIAPPTVSVEVRELQHGPGAIIPRDIPPMQAASEAYEEVFGRRPIFVREGGSIPVVALLKEELGMDTVLMGFGLPDDNLHAPNEKFDLEMFYKGIETVILFYQKLTRT